jgi:hypothetical protein
MAGDDVYARRAGMTMWGMSVLVDETGSDSYGATTISRAVASAQIGIAVVADRAGNDSYYTRDLGLAYAHGGLVPLMGFGTQAGIAVLADWEGDDRYEASRLPGGGYTHAAAENVGALAVLRDYIGSDTYVFNILAGAVAKDDAHVLLVDDAGFDLRSFKLVGGGEYGSKFISEGGLSNAPSNRSLAYFLDGEGADTYHRVSTCCDPLSHGNDLTRVDGRPDRRWGVFVDCETPPGARFPCEDQQDEVLVAMATTAAP